jgi:hypothetical protein
MCCGTGNLEVDMPSMPGRLFMSTINGEDVEMIKGQGMADILGANVFKYDFLNQADEELPKELLEKLTPGSKWVFFLNPPFVRGIGGSIISSEEETRSGMGNTAIGDTMGQEVGGARQNLITQFLWRIKSLTVAKKIDAVVAVFSTAIWMTGQNYDLFRNTWGNTFDHKAGFCFGSWEFEGAAGKWPVAMSIWRSKDV